MRFLFILFVCFIFQNLETRLIYAQEETADLQSELTRKGIEAYLMGQVKESLEILRKAAELSPKNEEARLNYGSMAYKAALDSKKQSMDEKIWKDLSLIAMSELSEAVQIGKDIDKSNQEAAHMTGQAAFLLGDLSHYLYDKPELARDYFEFAKQYWPENPNLVRELEIVNQKIDKNYVPKPLELHSVAR